MSKAKPILFSTAMVQAILDGRKTQTRRVVKTTAENLYKTANGGLAGFFTDRSIGDIVNSIKPKYQPGDILWVRERWANDCHHCFASLEEYGYCASCHFNDTGSCNCRRKPSIHMPRKAARIFLRVTGVRAERVQEITPVDCHAEGIINEQCIGCLEVGDICRPQTDVDVFCGNDEQLIEQYAILWDSLNNGHGFGWGANPWVWVYEFERVMQP